MKPQTKLEKKKAILSMLEQCKVGTTKSSVCKAVGISRTTLFKWEKEDEEFSQNIEELMYFIDETELDFTESKLMSSIDKENMQAIALKLKTKGRRRGYVERVEYENKEVENFTDEDKEILERFQKKGLDEDS